MGGRGLTGSGSQPARSLTSLICWETWKQHLEKLYFLASANIFSLRLFHMSLCSTYSQEIFQFWDSGLSLMTDFIDLEAKMYR